VTKMVEFGRGFEDSTWKLEEIWMNMTKSLCKYSMRKFSVIT